MRKDISIIELFSGIGMQRRGFENAGCYNVNVLATSEIASQAVITYATMHCSMTTEWLDSQPDLDYQIMADYVSNLNIDWNFKTNTPKDWSKCKTGKNYHKLKETYYACKLQNNLGDIKKIEELPKADLWFYSFPCTDISNAGRQKGLKKGSGTRSGLLWEVERLLEKAKANDSTPDYLCLENVKALLEKKCLPDFKLWLQRLDELGYNTYFDLLNSQNCNIPQNRPRVFAMSIKKDIDKKTFKFPKKMELKTVLADVLDKEFDDKYYLSKQVQERFHLTSFNDKDNIIGSTSPEFRTIGQRDIVYKQEATYIGALMATDYKQPKQILNVPFTPAIIQKYGDYGTSKYTVHNYANALCAHPMSDRIQMCIEEGKLLRKLTPNECFKLMGLSENDCSKAIAIGMSDTALYEMTGNGIVTNCVTLLAQHLFKAQENTSFICNDEK